MPGYHLPYFAAADNGIYERHGLKVEIVYPEPGPANVRAVAAGTYDLCLTSVAHFLNAKRESPDVAARFVFMVASRSHMALFAIAGRRASNGRIIESLTDIEGATFLGSKDSPFTREYQALLRLLGHRPGPVLDVAYGDVMQALATGRGDLAADFLDLSPAFESQARAQGAAIRPLPFHDAGLDIYGSGLVAGDALLRRRPEAVRAVAAAVGEALTATRRDPQVGLRGLAGRFPDADTGRALEGWRAGEPLIFAPGSESSLGAMTVDKWRRTIEYHAATHATPRLDPGEVFDDSFV